MPALVRRSLVTQHAAAAVCWWQVYCIGGLVDRSVSRHMTVSHAAKHGVATTARLPLREYCRMHNNALNIDTVVKILLEFRACNDWKQALETVVPQRRRVKEHPPKGVAAGERSTPSLGDQQEAAACEVRTEWLWVGGLPLGDRHSDCAAAAVEACVSCDGVVTTSFAQDCNFGFVQFADVEAAASAKMRLHRLQLVR